MIGHALALGIAQGHAHARVGDAAGAVHLRLVGLAHLEAGGEAHLFHVLALVA